MEQQRKAKWIMTTGAILLILVIFIGYFWMNKNDKEELPGKEAVVAESGDDGVQTGNGMEDAGNSSSDESESMGSEYSDEPVFIPEETYDTSFFGKSAQELYDLVFSVTEQETEYVHYYVKDGTLYLDEYECTDRQDEEGVYIYEWNRGQKIAEDVICVDYNWHTYGANALYITKDHVLHGTENYRDITLENIKYASVYGEQMLALTLDGNLWCRGVAHSISDGRRLEYQGWELVMRNVAYAQLAHYGYMAITEDGGLYMWGDNTFGQFGDGSLLTDGTTLNTECYFYPEPVKVADGIKMVWARHPGMPKQTKEYGGNGRTYFLTDDDRLYVSGENIGNETRSYRHFGELGWVEEPVSVTCTSVLHRVEMNNEQN